MTQQALPIIDAHQHFWDLSANYHPWLVDLPAPRMRYGDYTPLRHTYLPDDYRRDASGFNVVGTVYVEADFDPADPVGETRFVHGLAARYGLPTVMVGAARLDAPDVAEVLAAHAAFPLVRGIRHKPPILAAGDSPDSISPTAMRSPAWRQGVALLGRHAMSYDIQVPWWHLPELAGVAAEFPAIPIVVNHGGQIDTRDPEILRRWRAVLEQLARQPNVVMKISGLGLANRPWSLADNRGVIGDLIAIFGAERAMIGSNYPVDRLVGSFATIYGGLLEAIADLPLSSQAALLAGTARRVYRIAAV